MKKYTYTIFQQHTCTVQDVYDVEAESKEEADRMIVEAYKTGDERKIEHFERCADSIFDSLESSSTMPIIEDEHGSVLKVS